MRKDWAYWRWRLLPTVHRYRFGRRGGLGWWNLEAKRWPNGHFTITAVLGYWQWVILW